jgi:zinc and cadmium transporter
VGGHLPSLVLLTHIRKQLMMSLVSGVMLGVALLHMLPQAVENLPSVSWVGGAMLGGVLMMFFLVRVFHVHSHDHPEDHGDCQDEHHHHDHDKQNKLSWSVLLIGLTIHSLLDGVAMAASVVAEAGHDQASISLFGLGTFLAVFLHKPLDALAITSLMRSAASSDRSRVIVNILFALSCPLGALIFWLGAGQIAQGHSMVVGCALAFSAGFFLCIALSDLLPEVAFHSHDRLKLSAALLVGVILAFCIELTHSHGNDHEAKSKQHMEHKHDE